MRSLSSRKHQFTRHFLLFYILHSILLLLPTPRSVITLAEASEVTASDTSGVSAVSENGRGGEIESIGDVHAESEVSRGEENESQVHNVAAARSEDEAAPHKQSSKEPLRHMPPTHFQITAHIQTNLHTGISYFLNPAQSIANVPFLECGAIGSTTEGMPLVSGAFRHVPHSVVPPASANVELKTGHLEDLEEGTEGARETPSEESLPGEESGSGDGDVGEVIHETQILVDSVEVPPSEKAQEEPRSHQQEHHSPRRPSPPRYMVALSPLEIVVGGNTNETQRFQPGDVIFVEDTWWGIWNDFDHDEEEHDEDVQHLFQNSKGTKQTKQNEMKGYLIRSPSDSKLDMNVLMLTVTPAVHRHWKNIQHAKSRAQGNYNKRSIQQTNKHNGKQPWWKLSRLFHKSNTNSPVPPRPCLLESDPTYTHTSSPTLAQHLTRHFSNLGSFSTNHDLPPNSIHPSQTFHKILPLLAQTTAAALGGTTAFTLVVHLSRMISVTAAVGWGGVCMIGLGTWGVVWLGEEILEEWELWRERKRLERRMDAWRSGKQGHVEGRE